MKSVAVALVLVFAAPVAATLSGHYEGSVPFILDMNLNFPGDGTMNFDQNVKVAHKKIKCPTEKISETAAAITFPNIATTGDCMGDALREQKKDVTKFSVVINPDGSLTFKSDGWPDLKLIKKTVTLVALSGHYEGSVPFYGKCHRILDDGKCLQEDETLEDSCEDLGDKPSSCTASGWPVCCRGQESGGSNWYGVWWYKAGQKCSDLHEDGGTFAPCSVRTRQATINISHVVSV